MRLSSSRSPHLFPHRTSLPSSLGFEHISHPIKMTQPALLNFVRQRFCNRCHFFFPFLLPERLETALQSPTSFGCLKANTGNVTAREETASATTDIFPILLACHLPFSGHLIDSDTLYWVFHRKENFVIKS